MTEAQAVTTPEAPTRNGRSVEMTGITKSFFGNLLKESGVTGRLSKTASSAVLDTATILLGVAVGSYRMWMRSAAIEEEADGITHGI